LASGVQARGTQELFDIGPAAAARLISFILAYPHFDRRADTPAENQATEKIA
jgi:hypothetical protein